MVPGEFFFREKSDYLACRGLLFGIAVLGVDEKIIFEAGDIKEDGFVVEEEFGEEGKVLAVHLFLCK